MKHLKLFSAILCILFMSANINTAHAQIQKIKFGGFGLLGVGTSMNHYAPGTIGNFLPNVAFIAKNTYHNVIYDIVGNQAIVINGFVYSATEDFYLVTGKNLNKPGGTLGIGWEHAFTSGDLTIYIYGEYDTNWAYLTDLSKHFPSVGLILPLQFTAWQKKTKK